MPKYGPEIVKEICDLIASDDYTVDELCKMVGIVESTYYEWKSSHSEFSEAIKSAKKKRLEVFFKAARSGLLTLLQGKEFEEVTTEYVSDKKGKPQIKAQKKTKKVILPNPTSVIFALKNLDSDNFKDIVKQELTGGDGGPIKTVSEVDPSNLSKEELDLLIKLKRSM